MEIVVGELGVEVGILKIGFMLLLLLKCHSIYYNQNGFHGGKKKTIKNVIIPSEWCTSIHDFQTIFKGQGGFSYWRNY